VKNAKAASRTAKTDRVRLTVMDLAETAGIPVAKARKLIKDLGTDAEILLQAVEDSGRRGPAMR